MADNGSVLRDEDGDFEDWIEIHNPTGAPVNLAGWALTDDDDEPAKWVFPDVSIASGGFLVVYASGKNRGHSSTYWNTVIDRGDLFRYLPGTAAPPSNWNAEDFDHGGWSEGPSSLGYELDAGGAEIETSVESGIVTLYVRAEFTVSDLSSVLQALLHVDYDDAFVAYINGIEVARANISSTSPRFDTPADGNHEALIYQGGRPERFLVSDPQGVLKEGRNVLAIEVHNVSAGSSDLTLIPFLTLQSSTPPASPRGVAEILKPLGEENLHTNFRLNDEGEYLALVQPDASVASEYAPYPPQRTDVSYGLSGEAQAYFTTPTPGSANAVATEGFVSAPSLSAAHGLYDVPFSLYLFPETPGSTVRYTLDGSNPTLSNGFLYTEPIYISKTTVIRAAAFLTGWEPSDVVTRTFVFPQDVIRQSHSGGAPDGWPSFWGGNVVDFGMDPAVVNGRQAEVIEALESIPTISIVTPLPNLFNPQTGIYANAFSFGRDWERPASVELIFPDGRDGFQIDAGLRIRGGYSRADENPKHAFRLYFRDEYGDAKLRYPLFNGEGADEFDGVDLRTAQNYSWSFHGDQRNTFVRDVFARDTQRDMGQPYTRSRYYHLYLNGQYWGLYQTQERAEASYGETYFGGDKDNYDVIKSAGIANEYVMEATDGNVDAWRELWSEANRLAAARTEAERTEIYLKLQGMNPDGTRNESYPVLLDPDNLIDYMLVIFWTGNPDSPITPFMGTNNFFAVRDRTGERGFAYFAHDSEHSLLPENGLFNNRTGPFTAGSEFRFSNPQWIHQQMTGSLEYRLRFADLARKHLFNGGALTVQRAIDRWDARAAEVDPVIIAESARWGDSKREPPRTKDDWQREIDRVRNTVMPPRTETIIQQLKNARRFVDGMIGRGTMPAPLYPSLNAPDFSRYGGQVEAGFELAITAPSGVEVFYTFDGSDPRLIGGNVSPSATLYGGQAVPLSGRVIVSARSRSGEDWSALTRAEFTTGSAAPDGATLAVSEIHYNPAGLTAAEEAAGIESKEDLEFIELHNTATVAINLSGVAFTTGIRYTFGDVVLAPDERIVLVGDVDAFRTRYGAAPRVAGAFSGRLDNGGERIVLSGADGTVIHDVTYDDDNPWPARADGVGSSLERVGTHWRASIDFNGSPGTAGSEGGRVVINEVLSHTDPPLLDAIELFNTTTSSIDVGGWLLSDSSRFDKFRIPPGTMVPAGGYVVFDENDFNATGTAADFALNGAHGDEVWLVETGPSGNPIRFDDHVVFGAARNGEALGRWPNGVGDLYPMAIRTLGSENSGPRAAGVIVREIMYHPPGNNENLEYVQLLNASTSPIDLGGWQLAGGVRFTFENGILLAPGDSLLVTAFDPLVEFEKASTFRLAYGWSPAAGIVGGWEGRLANDGETLALTRPDAPPNDEPDFLPQTIEERVTFGDDLPWPREADGGGYALRRRPDAVFAGDPASWTLMRRTLVTHGIDDGEEPPEIPDSGFLVSEIYPSPSSGQAQLALVVRDAQHVTVSLYDILGRRISILHDAVVANESFTRLTIDGSKLSSGLYFVQVAARDFKESRSVVFVR